ncbi:hypothetical protein [Haloarcula sediminis]|uniref:hypothetical protein n=1 Tax=Haloarcula sediminis TaxID=3111777 RepID=UPI002D799C4C|nr:hypothetical protein [Haloarcula sp. CK38]
MTLGEDNIGQKLGTEKDGEFRCESCRARCSRSPNDGTEYGHHTGCPHRPDEFPAGGKYIENCDHAPAQVGDRAVATDGGNTGDRQTHLGESGLWIPTDLREFDQQIVFRTPKGTIQHFGSESLDGYYGMVTAEDFGPAEDFTDPKNPDLAPNRVRIKPQGEEPIEFVVDLDPDVRCDGGIDRSSLSMAEFNDLLNTDVEKASPTTHAPIIRDDNDLLIYADRSRNADSEWEIRAYRVVTHGLRLRFEDRDRASIAAIFLEHFDTDELTRNVENSTRAIHHGVPVAVAVDGKPAVAAWRYTRGADREELANQMGVGKATVSEYLSRFRRRGVGIPDGLDCPEVGEIVSEVPEHLNPGSQQIVADGGDSA